MIEREFGPIRVSVRGSGRVGALVIADTADVAQLADAFPRMPLASVACADWDRNLTPWPAAIGGRQFSGEGEACLSTLIGCALPWLEEQTGARKWQIAGYSLGGLFALWAALRTDAFVGAASVSGSMWYPGFLAWMDGARHSPARAYLSVGAREKRSRNPAFATIEQDTRRAVEQLGRMGVQTRWEINPGGHFQDPVGRMRRALQWLLDEAGKEA